MNTAAGDRAKVIPIVECNGYICNRDGLDVDAVKEHPLATESVLGFEGAESHGDGAYGIKRSPIFERLPAVWRPKASPRLTKPSASDFTRKV